MWLVDLMLNYDVLKWLLQVISLWVFPPCGIGWDSSCILDYFAIIFQNRNETFLIKSISSSMLVISMNRGYNASGVPPKRDFLSSFPIWGWDSIILLRKAKVFSSPKLPNLEKRHVMQDYLLFTSPRWFAQSILWMSAESLQVAVFRISSPSCKWNVSYLTSAGEEAMLLQPSLCFRLCLLTKQESSTMEKGKKGVESGATYCASLGWELLHSVLFAY